MENIKIKILYEAEECFTEKEKRPYIRQTFVGKDGLRYAFNTGAVINEKLAELLSKGECPVESYERKTFNNITWMEIKLPEEFKSGKKIVAIFE